MRTETELHCRGGLTRWQIAGILAVVAILVVPFQSARGTGSRKIVIHLTGTSVDRSPTHVALILRQHADFLLVDPSHPEIRWQRVLPEQDFVESLVKYATESTSGILMFFGTRIIPYQDAVVVAYRTGEERPRFRLIPFELSRSGDPIEIDVPRDPPSDAEAWKPPTNRETTAP